MRSGQPGTSWWLGSMTPDRAPVEAEEEGRNQASGQKKHTQEAPAFSLLSWKQRTHTKYKRNDCVGCKRIMSLRLKWNEARSRWKPRPHRTDRRQDGWFYRSAASCKQNHTSGHQTSQHLPTKSEGHIVSDQIYTFTQSVKPRGSLCQIETRGN